MWLLLQIAVLVLAIVGTALRRLSLHIWVPSFALLLILFTIFTTPPWGFLIVCWIIYFIVILFFCVTPIRHQFLTKPLMQRVKKILPPMSDTEQVALEAGDVWWEAELFRGRPNWKKLQQMSFVALTEAEQLFLDNQVETLCSMLDDFNIVYKHSDLPKEVWNYLKKERFFGLVIPKEYGGHGFSALAHSSVVAKVASRSITAAVNMMVPNSLGPGELIYHYGTEQQKQYYLPRLAQGEEIPCFALTAPEAGSDASGITDTGIICKGEYEGKEIIGICLNFDKRYITLAPIATVIGVAFKLYDPEHLMGEQSEIGITLGLIPAKHQGIEAGTRHLPSGLAFMNGPVRGNDVFIPLDWIIGGKEMAGQGWRMLMECLSIGRSVSLPALSTAISTLSYRTTGAYARIRKQFKLPIGRFEGVEEALAQIAGFTYLIEAARRFTVAAVDHKLKPSLASAIAKYHMTELARKVMDHAMDVHAGRGIQLGPRNYLGLVYQSVPISITVEGANILTRNLIIFGQGAMRCHPFVRDEMAAILNSDQHEGFIQFDYLLLKHLGYIASNFVTTFAMGLGITGFVTVPNGSIARYYRQLTRMSSALAFVTDVTLASLGGNLKRKERLSARLGDVLSYLYLASSVLKYYEDQQRTDEDWPHVEWAVQYCLYQAQESFIAFFANFPQRFTAKLLRFFVFPLGRSYKKPSDQLDHQLAQKMQTHSALRNRLTAYCYIGKGAQDPVGRMDIALSKVVAVEALEKKLQTALQNGMLNDVSHSPVTFVDRITNAVKAGVLTQEEAELLNVAEQMRLDAVAVDEFAKL
jgi:acyl-CoA dehydrogenase